MLRVPPLLLVLLRELNAHERRLLSPPLPPLLPVLLLDGFSAESSRSDCKSNSASSLDAEDSSERTGKRACPLSGSSGRTEE